MFKKPVKIKTNNQLKASDRKQFKDLLLKSFPALTEDQLNEYLPKKEPVNCLKVITSDNVILQVYTVQKRPIAFDYKSRLFPTIYLLWQFPDLIHSFTTHDQVARYLYSGADLMLPGVVVPSHGCRYGAVVENEIVAVNLTNNRAAIAVGTASQSAGGMIQAHGKGKCVNILHSYGDHLCTIEDASIGVIPDLGTPDWLKSGGSSTSSGFDEEFPELGATRKHHEQLISKQDGGDQPISEQDGGDQPISEQDGGEQMINEQDGDKQLIEHEQDSVEDMDQLLTYCFLGAIKYSKTLQLPALTSNFFKLHVLPLCPPDKNLDLKKTSFKKLKPFLEKMSLDGVVTVKEIKKGVEAITAINKDHPLVSQFYIEPANRPKKDDAGTQNEPKTNVLESYIITNNLLPLFETSGYKKGDVVQPPEVRKCVTAYVKQHNMQDEANPKLIRPKQSLASICKTENPITWEEAIEKVCDAMKNCYKVKSGMVELTSKGKIPPINITVKMRSGNKKVTLIDNLEVFGIKVNDFAKECQHGVAASTSISRPQGMKSDQLLVQGNQVLFVYNLLIDKYKVPKMYVKGLEYAPKKK